MYFINKLKHQKYENLIKNIGFSFENTHQTFYFTLLENINPHTPFFAKNF